MTTSLKYHCWTCRSHRDLQSAMWSASTAADRATYLNDGVTDTQSLGTVTNRVCHENQNFCASHHGHIPSLIALIVALDSLSSKGRPSPDRARDTFRCIFTSPSDSFEPGLLPLLAFDIAESLRGGNGEGIGDLAWRLRSGSRAQQ